MIKIDKELWENLQKKGFFDSPITNQQLSYIYNKKMYETRIVRWRIRGFNLPFYDIREAFKQTKEKDKELIDFYSDCKVMTSGYLDYDKTAIKVAQKVTFRLKYQEDSATYKSDEYWARPIDIHRKTKDDCDGYACLTCYVCGLLGIPSFRRFVRLGYVNDGSGAIGHATFVYLSTRTNEFYPLEGSYYSALSWMNFDKIPLRNNPFYKETWYLTNEKDSYGTNPLIQIIK